MNSAQMVALLILINDVSHNGSSRMKLRNLYKQFTEKSLQLEGKTYNQYNNKKTLFQK